MSKVFYCICSGDHAAKLGNALLRANLFDEVRLPAIACAAARGRQLRVVVAPDMDERVLFTLKDLAPGGFHAGELVVLVTPERARAGVPVCYYRWLVRAVNKLCPTLNQPLNGIHTCSGRHAGRVPRHRGSAARHCRYVTCSRGQLSLLHAA